jgi:hypothetical protein
MEDMPMGSMAHAFAALQRQRGGILTEEEEAEQAATAEAQPSAPADVDETVTQAVAGEELGTISGVTTSRDMDATEAMGGLDFEPGTEGTTTEVFPEADANAGSEATGDVLEGTGPAIGETDETEAAADSGDGEAMEAIDAGEAETEAEEAMVSQTAAPEVEEATEEVAAAPEAEDASMTDVVTDSGEMPAEEEAATADEDEVKAEASMPASAEVSEAAEEVEAAGEAEASETEASETEAGETEAVEAKAPPTAKSRSKSKGSAASEAADSASSEAEGGEGEK